MPKDNRLRPILALIALPFLEEIVSESRIYSALISCVYIKQGLNPKSTRPSLRPETSASSVEPLRPRGTSSEPQSNSSSRAEARNTKCPQNNRKFTIKMAKRPFVVGIGCLLDSMGHD